MFQRAVITIITSLGGCMQKDRPFAPSFAKEQAIAFPKPLAPPVMKAKPGATGPLRK